MSNNGLEQGAEAQGRANVTVAAAAQTTKAKANRTREAAAAAQHNQSGDEPHKEEGGGVDGHAHDE